MGIFLLLYLHQKYMMVFHSKIEEYTNIAQTLCKHCANIAQTLRKHCANIAQTLRKHCANIAQTLHKHCTNIAQTLHKHCTNIKVIDCYFNCHLTNLFPYCLPICYLFLDSSCRRCSGMGPFYKVK